MLDKHGHHFTIRARPIETERGHVEGLLVALLETTSQSIIAVDPQGVIVLANGYGDDVWLSARGTGRQNLEILIPVESRQRHIRRHRISFKEMESRRMAVNTGLTALHKDGTTFPVEIKPCLHPTAARQVRGSLRQLENEARVRAEEVRILASRLLKRDRSYHHRTL